jgi:hypothetical protein
MASGGQMAKPGEAECVCLGHFGVWLLFLLLCSKHSIMQLMEISVFLCIIYLSIFGGTDV